MGNACHLIRGLEFSVPPPPSTFGEADFDWGAGVPNPCIFQGSTVLALYFSDIFIRDGHSLLTFEAKIFTELNHIGRKVSFMLILAEKF